jgi:hypothetical protein
MNDHYAVCSPQESDSGVDAQGSKVNTWHSTVSTCRHVSYPTHKSDLLLICLPKVTHVVM